MVELNIHLNGGVCSNDFLFLFIYRGGTNQLNVEIPEDQNSPMHARRSSRGSNINGKDIFYHT